jgi:hypothetical protein
MRKALERIAIHFEAFTECPFEFRMYDDDGLLYYSGKSSEYATFDPLDDYGAPNAGCYQN